MNPTTATKTELSPASDEELFRVEGGVNGHDGGCIPLPPIKGGTGPTYPIETVIPVGPFARA